MSRHCAGVTRYHVTLKRVLLTPFAPTYSCTNNADRQHDFHRIDKTMTVTLMK